MQPGDSFFLALDKQGRALIILTSEGSTTQNQLMSGKRITASPIRRSIPANLPN
jgi:hypothetical protein